jgi:hypothetical protein
MRCRFIPYVPGLHHFRRQMLHRCARSPTTHTSSHATSRSRRLGLFVSISRWWRSPTPFKGKKVLVVGSRASGGDITHDLSLQNLALPEGSPDRATIYQSTRGPIDDLFPMPVERWTQQVTALPELDHVDDAGDLHFKDGSVLRDDAIDVIVWATGYSYSVSFAQPTDEPWRSHPLIQPREGRAKPGDLPEDKVDRSLRSRGGAQIDNLDSGLQSFYVPDPSVAFIGLAYMVVPFRLSEVQARVIAHSWVTQSLPQGLPPLVPENEKVPLHTVGFPTEADAADRWLKGQHKRRTLPPGLLLISLENPPTSLQPSARATQTAPGMRRPRSGSDRGHRLRTSARSSTATDRALELLERASVLDDRLEHVLLSLDRPDGRCEVCHKIPLTQMPSRGERERESEREIRMLHYPPPIDGASRPTDGASLAWLPSAPCRARRRPWLCSSRPPRSQAGSPRPASESLTARPRRRPLRPFGRLRPTRRARARQRRERRPVHWRARLFPPSPRRVRASGTLAPGCTSPRAETLGCPAGGTWARPERCSGTG